MAAATVQVALRNMQSRAELVHMNGLVQMRFQILKEPGNDVLLAGAVFGGKRGRVLQADQPDQQKMQQRAKLGIAAGPARPDILVAGHQGRGVRRGQDLRKVQNARETELLQKPVLTGIRMQIEENFIGVHMIEGGGAVNAVGRDEHHTAGSEQEMLVLSSKVRPALCLQHQLDARADQVLQGFKILLRPMRKIVDLNTEIGQIGGQRVRVRAKGVEPIGQFHAFPPLD